MGYIEKKYIVTEYSYFEDTEENLQAIEDKNFDFNNTFNLSSKSSMKKGLNLFFGESNSEIL